MATEDSPSHISGQASEDGSGGTRPRVTGWPFFVLVSLAIFFILFMSGQLALTFPPRIAQASMHSGMKADYSYWQPIAIQPVDPGIIEDLRRDNRAIPNELIAVGNYWPVPTGEFATAVTATQTPEDIQARVTPFPVVLLPATSTNPPPYQPPQVVVPSSTATSPPGPPLSPPTATRTPTRFPTQVPTWTPSRTPTRTPTNTATSSRTPTRTLAPTVTTSLTPTSTRTPTRTPTRTRVPTLVPTTTLTPTGTATHTPTATHTAVGTSTATATATDTSAPTATNTPTAIPLPPGIEIGPPDGNPLDLDCGSDVIVDLGELRWIQTLIFYEYLNPAVCINSSMETGICLDWIVIELGEYAEGPWTGVFYWGDSIGSNNGSVPPYHYATQEMDNEVIPQSELHNGSGILIPVDGDYRFVRFYAPTPCDDPAQIDAIETIP